MADQKDKLERRSSKSRLSKQDEVEEVEEEDTSPSSETSDATIVPAAGHDTPVVQTPGGTPESDSPEEHKERRLESQRSTDSDKSSPTQGGHPKVKLLVRSHALCDDASPPPEETVTLTTPCNNNTATLSVASLSPTPSHKSYRHKIEKDGSQSSVSEAGTSPCLSRDSSVETQYTDSTGIDLEEFIKMTLNKNSKDKMMLLKLEQDLSNFIKESKHEYLKFPQMTSYHRMLVHRVAAFFGLDHNVDQSGKCVIVNRTSNTRIPDFKFRDHVNDDGSQDDPPKRQILKRESASLDEGRGSNKHGMDGKKSKSFEEREQNYNQARARIFNEEASSSQDGATLESPIGMDVVRTGTRPSSSRSSKEDLRWAAEPRPWSSTDSSGYGTDTSSKANKVAGMTKASSFGGVSVNVTVLSRSDSRNSNYSGGRISKTTTSDSLSSGVSSLGSPMTRPPPIPSSPPPDSQSISESSSSSHSAPSPSHLHPNAGESVSPGSVLPQLPFSMDGGQPVAWWVASSMSVIPPGSVLINPQTGQPFMNPDGSVYRYQPSPTRQSQQPMQAQGTPQQQQNQLQAGTTAQQAVPQTFTHYNPPQVMVGSSDQKLYAPSDGSGEMTHQFSQLTLTPQSSTELSEPPGGGPHQQSQQPPPPQQQMYVLTSPSQPSSQQPSMPQMGQQPQQMQPQQGFVPPQQVPYYGTTQQSSAAQVQIMYPNVTYSTPQQPLLQTQGSIESQQPPQSASGQGQYSSQYVHGYTGPRTGMAPSTATGAGYQMIGYPSMGVPSGDGYQAPPGSYQPGAGPSYQPQTDLSAMAPPPQGTYAQYPSVSGAQTCTQPSYVQQQQQQQQPQQQQQQQQTPCSVYYSSNTACTNGAAASGALTSVTFPNMGQSQATYRPRTPPSQGGTGNVGSVGPSVSVNGVGVIGGQYMPYPAPNPTGAPYPQPVQPRQQTSQVVPFQTMPHTHSPPQPAFPVVRPNMQMSMQMQTRTTPPPPPPPSSQYPHVAMVSTSSQPMKLYGVDQRPPKSVDLYNPELNKDSSALSVQASQVVALPKGSPAVGVRAAGPPYRAPTPLCPDVRLQLTNPPLQQQFARPQLQPLFTRPRMPAVTAQTSSNSSNKMQKGRKSWTRSSKDSTSPHSSTESTENYDSLTCSMAGTVLEVVGLPQGISRSDLEATCDDLIKLGAQLHLVDSSSKGQQWPEPVVLAVFDSLGSAQRALSSHKSTLYCLQETSHEPPS